MCSTLLVVLKNFPGQQLSVMDLTKITSILAEDVTATLQSLGILLQTSTGYVIACPDELLSDLMLKYPCTGQYQSPHDANIFSHFFLFPFVIYDTHITWNQYLTHWPQHCAYLTDI